MLTTGWLTDAKLWRPQQRITDVENIQVGEAEAWWNGRLDLTERRWDTALKNGRIYSHFPPLFSLIAAGVIPLLGGVPHLLIVVAIALPVVGALLLFHGTGWDQRGFNRFSLDYIIVLFALIVPACLAGRRRWISLAMIAWSLVYFVVIQPMPNVRIL